MAQGLAHWQRKICREVGFLSCSRIHARSFSECAGRIGGTAHKMQTAGRKQQSTERCSLLLCVCCAGGLLRLIARGGDQASHRKGGAADPRHGTKLLASKQEPGQAGRPQRLGGEDDLGLCRGHCPLALQGSQAQRRDGDTISC